MEAGRSRIIRIEKDSQNFVAGEAGFTGLKIINRIF